MSETITCIDIGTFEVAVCDTETGTYCVSVSGEGDLQKFIDKQLGNEIITTRVTNVADEAFVSRVVNIQENTVTLEII